MTTPHIFLHSLVHWVDLVGMILLVGALVFRTLVVSPSFARNSWVQIFLPFLLLLTGLGDLLLRSMMMSGQPLTDVWAFLPKVIFSSHFGKVWMARTLLLCLISGASIVRISERFGGVLALIASTLLLLTASLSGHAAVAGDLSLAVLANWLHLVASSSWLGGLFFLALLLRKWVRYSRPEATLAGLIVSVGRFSKLAGFCVALILTTGSYQAWYQVGNQEALLWTAYGQTLLVKLSLVLSLVGLGALNRYWILPMFSQPGLLQSESSVGVALRRLLNIVTFEIGIGLGVIVCVALLMQLPPARSHRVIHPHASAQTVSELTLSQGELCESPTIEHAKVKVISSNEWQIYVSEAVLPRYLACQRERFAPSDIYEQISEGLIQRAYGTASPWP